jgi:hypothetical protein
MAVRYGARTPTSAPLTVTDDAATLSFTDTSAYLTATIDAAVELTLAHPKVGAYKHVELTNDGTVTAPTFAAGPTVKKSGSGTWVTTDGAINEMRIECVSASGSGSYRYALNQREA